MKILPISQPVEQNFKGLWGRKSGKLEYYPFYKETSAQTEAETNKYKGLVTIMTALPFTSKEFLKYTKNRLAITKQRLIEKYFVSKGLSTVVK